MSRLALVALGLAGVLAAQSLKLVKTIPLGNIQGRIDHMGVDIAGKRIFVAALGQNAVEVVDLALGRVTHSIPELRAPQGVFYWPEEKRLYVANDGDGSLRVFDGNSFQLLKTYDFNSDADNLRFGPKMRELFVGYGDGALGVVNLNLKSRIGDIFLSGHPESFQLERHGYRIFINVPHAASGARVVVIDRRSRSIVSKWSIAEKENFPMALDEADGRLFIGCRDPAKLLVLETLSGKTIARVDIPGDADDVFYDASTKRIYVSGGSGEVGVISRKDSDHYIEVARLKTADGARTSLLVPEFGQLFVAVPQRRKQESVLLVYSTDGYHSILQRDR